MSEPPTPPTLPTKLKFLQCNLFLRPFIASNPSQGDFKAERLQVFLEVLEKGEYDVVMLQECFEGINVGGLGCGGGRR